jgi:hypothetical protein
MMNAAAVDERRKSYQAAINSLGEKGGEEIVAEYINAFSLSICH